MKLVLQAQAAECGLACLAMIAAAHGRHVGLDDLRRQFPTSLKGSTLDRLISDAAVCGLAARPLRLEVDEVDQLQLPCILHWDLNHFVVLERVRPGRIRIFDPAAGVRNLSRESFSRHFTGVAIELTPTVDFRTEAPKPRPGIGVMLGSVRGLRRALAQIFAVAIALEAFAIAAPMLNQVLLDQVLASGDRELLDVVVLGFGLLLTIQTLLSLARSWMVMVLGQSLGLQWVGNVFAHLIRLPVSYFENRHLGDIVSRFSAVGDIQRTFTTSAIEAVLDGLMALAAFGMMMLYSPSLTAVTVCALILYVLVRVMSFAPYREAAAERLIVSAKESTHFLETLRAIMPLKLFGREEERRVRWQNLVVDVQNRDVRTARMNILFVSANTLIFGVENLCVFWLGARGIISASHDPTAASLSIGMLFAFLGYKAQLTGRLTGLVNYAVEWRMLGLHLERLGDIVLAEPERDLHRDGGIERIAALPASIELRRVSFRYGEGEPWILRDVSLKVDAGEHVAITGPSGAGKTTLLKIALGLLEPTEGEVHYGGHPLRRLGLRSVRASIGTVMQEDVLMTGSLAENIAFFDVRPDRARIEECARAASVHYEILQMPMGYETLIGDLGHGLSGGQRQRILLARALYKNPRVLALDEASSHLDVVNERAVNDSLRQMRLTRLAIAHRSETIAAADRVVEVREQSAFERTPQLLKQQTVDAPGRCDVANA